MNFQGTFKKKRYSIPFQLLGVNGDETKVTERDNDVNSKADRQCGVHCGLGSLRKHTVRDLQREVLSAERKRGPAKYCRPLKANVRNSCERSYKSSSTSYRGSRYCASYGTSYALVIVGVKRGYGALDEDASVGECYSESAGEAYTS